jgi:hypothetical protein
MSLNETLFEIKMIKSNYNFSNYIRILNRSSPIFKIALQKGK